MKNNRFNNAALLFLVFTSGFNGSCLKESEGDAVISAGSGTNVYNWLSIADTAQTSLNFFWSASGNYYLAANGSSNWAAYWPNAHALDVLIDAYLRNPAPGIKVQMDNLMTGVRAKNGNTWIGYYYDDMEWMALAALRAYTATHDVLYKNCSDTLWQDIKKGWSTDLGGGIWWRKDNPSKNTPSNMPAAILAARRYELFNATADLQWAVQIYNWEKAVLYESTGGQVYDNIDKNGNKNTNWKFTYNQGTFLGAALELYKITGNSQYQGDAIQAADYAVSSGFLTSNGILKDEGGGDGGLFKGIFVRYLTRLIMEGMLDAGKKSGYISFLRANGESLWSKGTNKNLLLFGSGWDKAPGNTTDLTIQLSGIMLIEALAELKKAQLF